MKQQALFPGESPSRKSWFSEAIETLRVDEVSGWPDVFGSKMFDYQAKTGIADIRVLSLFSGGGGLDIGFHDAGFTIVECIEIEKLFTDTLSANSTHGGRLQGANIICRDINDYDPKLRDIDFIIGGPPCQTFSAAGARAAGVSGIDDERGSLFTQYVRILKKLKPKGFLFENVYRIVGAQNGKPWQIIRNAFADAGYKLHWRIVDAADYGAPQFRERLIIVGLREGNFFYPWPTHGPDSKDQRPYYNAGKAIETVASETNGKPIGGRHGHLLDDIPSGLNYSFYTDRMGHPTPVFGWRSKFSDYLYKADPDTPVRTIKAQGGQYTGPFHWESRTFTTEEMKRLQTFPDDYEIVGKRQKIIHQLGNSVPPQLARALALSIAQQVFNTALPFDIDLLDESQELGFRKRKREITKIYERKAKEAIDKIRRQPSQEKSLYENEKENNYLLSRTLTIEPATNEDFDYCFDHVVRAGSIEIFLRSREEDDEVKYQFIIEALDKIPKKTSVNRIAMHSSSSEYSSVTALWKYLEMLIRKHFFKDDLVQFFGYYQYANSYLITMTLDNQRLKREAFWKTLKNISRGELVGSVQSLDEISNEYGLPRSDLLDSLKKLKKLGYEIRSSNTNNQIRHGHFLAPYPFPSLNERSLQRLTEL